MKKRTLMTHEDVLLFRNEVKGIKALSQDKIHYRPQKPLLRKPSARRLLQENADNSFYFSDEYQPLLESEGAVRYVRAGSNHFELKKLRRGDYIPELFLDLHGLTQQQTKEELAALITACCDENISCACVMHGYGKQILKQQIPRWLAQHPKVIAFHQAPKEWGGNAALLFLIDVEE